MKSDPSKPSSLSPAELVNSGDIYSVRKYISDDASSIANVFSIHSMVINDIHNRLFYRFTM